MIDMVEAAYDLGASPHDWMHRLVALALQLMRGGRIGVGYYCDFSRPARPAFSSAVVINGPPGFPRDTEQIFAALRTEEPHTVERIHVSLPAGPAGTLSEQLGPSFRSSRTGQFLARFGSCDSFGCICMDPEGQGVVLSTDLPAATRLAPAVRARWAQVAAHVAAGARLRRRRDEEGLEAAVLSPGGRVVHAQGEATAATARERLREAVRAIDAARTRRGRARPAESLSMWEGLIAGRWSMLERFESDGRRFFVARRNDPCVPGPTALTERERQVIGYAAMGHPLKLIAYELGLGVSTVAEHRASAMRKLRLRSLAELAALKGAGPDLR